MVVHGPEAVDTGLASDLIKILKEKGEVRAVMSGYTGVAAVIDAGLEDIIAIDRHRIPSVTIIEEGGDADAIFLANSAKSLESALRFGSIVHQRVEGRLTRPLVQVDQEAVISWNPEGDGLARWLSEVLHRPYQRGRVDLASRSRSPQNEWRELGGVLPGENVWVNGVVVGKATSDRVMIGRDGAGHIIAQGIELKATGIARLGIYDQHKAHVRSGVVRRTMVPVRVRQGKRSSGTFLIDHAAERAIYHCRDASLVVTVGDDTSRTAGSVLARFGVPIVAIVDGDEDGISTDHALAEGSIVLRMRSGTDDLVGADVREIVFKGRNWLDASIDPTEMARRIVDIAKERYGDVNRP